MAGSPRFTIASRVKGRCSILSGQPALVAVSLDVRRIIAAGGARR